MSLILSQWLSTDVKLTKQVPPDQLDSVFRNGFLLGQVLYKLKLNDDFHIDFVNSTTTDAAIKNYSSLERLLREKLGISLTAGDAIDLITAKQGSAAKLLHLIKCAHLQKTQITSIEEKNNPPIKKLSNLPPLVRSSSAMSYNGTAGVLT